MKLSLLAYPHVFRPALAQSIELSSEILGTELTQALPESLEVSVVDVRLVIL